MVDYNDDFLQIHAVWCGPYGFELPAGGARMDAHRNNPLEAQPSTVRHENHVEIQAHHSNAWDAGHSRTE